MVKVLVALKRGGYRRVPLKEINKTKFTRERRVLWGKRRRVWVPKPEHISPPPPVERVTVGTGISVENRSSRGLRLSFTWSKVVLRSDVEQAKRDGESWIRVKFGEVASRLSPKYLKEWGLEEMDNFAGYNREVATWDPRDLGRWERSWTVNGTEHRE